ncbi:SpoIIE family protein phosphatase [Streptomyces specialis]|uniref:SpoIIE family protein phosphatase n=1 Tax=Streptomyces specialis TaxID=498367 RepID=UPI00073EC530|nr:SpoIIE family protein phosphatase [Streptomyces specialis]
MAIFDARSESVNGAALLLDARGAVASWTREAGELLGYASDEVLGREAAFLLTPEDAGRLPALVERCLAERGWTGMLSGRHRDGHTVTVGARVSPLTGRDGDGGGRWLVLAVDLAAAPHQEPTRRVLDRVFARSPVGVGVVDRDLRYVWANDALAALEEVPVKRRLGRRPGETLPGLGSQVVEEKLTEVLRTGEAVRDYEHVLRSRTEPGREHVHALAAVRMEDESGEPLGVLYTLTDVTERYRSRHRLALLDRAGDFIGRSLDVARTGQDLADIAVPDLADFVAVDLLEPVLRGGEPASAAASAPVTGPDGRAAGPVPFRRAGHQSGRDGVPEAVVGIGDEARYHRWSPPARTLVSGRSWGRERLDPGAHEWAAGIPGGRAARFAELGLHTAMILPIRAGGVTLGITSFFRHRRKEPFTEADLRLAEEFVARAAVCIDNARRYTRERDAALALQRTLLPHSVPGLNAVDIGSRYRPADELSGVGGDWFDVLPLSGARTALVVGEVVGHGIHAAAIMGRLRTAVQTLAGQDLEPEELLGHLDDLVCRIAEEHSAAPPDADAGVVGTTCLYAVYDPVSRRCAMASAGHPPPALIGPGADVEFLQVPAGPALGVDGPPFRSTEVTLEEGSVLALYTDGLCGGEHGDHGDGTGDGGGLERLRAALRAPGLALDGLARDVVDRLVPARPSDDAALLLVRTHGLGPGRVATWEVDAEPAAVARARESASGQLADWGLGDLASTTELVVSELVTNAIRHASGRVRLRLIREHVLTCEVSDRSSTSPHLRHARATDEGGRGLFLVSRFTHRWGTRYSGEGKTIWAEQLVPR